MEIQGKEEFEQVNMFWHRTTPNTGFARYFTGNRIWNPLTKPGVISICVSGKCDL